MSWGLMGAMFSGRQVHLSALAWVMMASTLRHARAPAHTRTHTHTRTRARAHTHTHTHYTYTHCRRVVRAAPTQRRRVRAHRPGILVH